MHRKVDLRNKSGGGGKDHVATVNFTREEGVGTTYHTTKIFSSQYGLLNRMRPLARLGDEW